MRKLILVVFFAIIFNTVFEVSAFADVIPSGGGSYSYAAGGQERYSPPLYKPEKTWKLTADDLYAYDGRLYGIDGYAGIVTVCDDSGNKLDEIVLVLDNGDPAYLGDNAGLFVCANGIYTASPENGAVYVFGFDGALKQTFVKPESSIYDAAVKFAPIGVLVDSSDCVYILVDGLYSGAVVYSPEGEFLGFYGSNTVEMSAQARIEQLWKNILTKEQAEAMRRFVPVAYTGFDIDSEDFIYTVSADAESAYARIRKLNPAGASLWSNDKFFGDNVAYAKGMPNSNRFVDVCVDGDGTVSALDASYGRIFQYDANGRLLGVLGGIGTQLGTFTEPIAIECLNSKLFVSDKTSGLITSFVQTEYGDAFLTAVRLYSDGRYADAFPYWQKASAFNAYSEYINEGMGKAYAGSGNITAALTVMKSADSREGYSAVFTDYRAGFIRSNFNIIALIICIVIIGIVLVLKLAGKQLAAATIPVRRHLRVMISPVSALTDLIQHNRLSVVFGVVLVSLWTLSKILDFFFTGYIFNSSLGERFRILPMFVSTVGIFILWVLVNWAVSTLNDGKGKAKTVFCASAYALMPYLLCRFAYIPLSRVFTLDEGAFLIWLTMFGALWSAIMLICAVMTVHDFTLGKTVSNIVITLLGICITAFLLSVTVTLFEHVIGLFHIAYNEIMLRR